MTASASKAVKRVRLTPAQSEVVEMMQAGWELASSSGFHTSEWVQEGGAGKGGKSKRLRAGTCAALEKKGWVERAGYRFPTVTYKLKKVSP